MKPPITGFWGKLQRDPDGHELLSWHPLQDHCADVSACLLALLELDSWRTRLARASQVDDWPEAWTHRLGVLAALHDLGKFNHGFQSKADPLSNLHAGHVEEGISALRSLHGIPGMLEALDVTTLVSWNAEPLLFASLHHHGGPPAGLGVAENYLWGAKSGRPLPSSGVASLMEAARGWFPTAWGDADPFPNSPQLAHLFAGAVMLADWLGSDRLAFPYTTEVDNDDRFGRSLTRARTLLADVGLDPSGPREAANTRGPVSFGHFAAQPDWTPRGVQRLVFEDLVLPTKPSTLLIEADTGAGKTEAAFGWFARLFQQGAVDGIYFALPLRAAATQIHGRLTRMMERWVTTNHLRPVLAVPGYMQVGDSVGQKLPRFEHLWPDEPQDRNAHHTWAAENAKRYFASGAAAGTIDQLLLAGMAVRHAHLRAATVHRHLIVVDEVHASDPYMARILGRVLTHHRALGGHALLLSATLGTRSLPELVGLPTPEHIDDANAVPYPRVLLVEEGRPAVESAVSQHEIAQKLVDIDVRPLIAEPHAIAELATTAAREGARVLVLRNTVRGCVAVQSHVEELLSDSPAHLFAPGGCPAPHHGRFAPGDRRHLDAAIQAFFSPGRAAGSGGVAVTTQTCEQSLDIDADLLITDLCPVDVLLQRIGRLHRHKNTGRPKRYEQARCIVLSPMEPLSTLVRARNGELTGPHGLGQVYSDIVAIQATLHLAEQERCWTIPEDNRRLVEAVTHPAAQAQAVSLDPELVKLDQTSRGLSAAKGSQATARLLDFTAPYLELDALERRLPTRLGDPSLRVLLPRVWRSPLGADVSELRVPAWMFGTTDVDPSTAVVDEMTPLRITLTLGGKRLKYDRYGLGQC